MDQAADSRDVSYFIQTFVERTMHEKVAREQRLNHAHRTTPGRTLHPKTRVKHFQPKVSGQAGRSDMFMFRLRPHAIPRWRAKRLDLWKHQNSPHSSVTPARSGDQRHR